MAPAKLFLEKQRFANDIARHEMGHLIIARALGFKTEGCHVMLIGGLDGHEAGSKIELARPLRSTADVMDYLEHRIQVLYAGAFAQSLTSRGKVDQTEASLFFEKGAQNDHKKAEELLHILRNLKFPADETIEQILQHLVDRL